MSVFDMFYQFCHKTAPGFNHLSETVFPIHMHLNYCMRKQMVNDLAKRFLMQHKKAHLKGACKLRNRIHSVLWYAGVLESLANKKLPACWLFNSVWGTCNMRGASQSTDMVSHSQNFLNKKYVNHFVLWDAVAVQINGQLMWTLWGSCICEVFFQSTEMVSQCLHQTLLLFSVDSIQPPLMSNP